MDQISSRVNLLRKGVLVMPQALCLTHSEDPDKMRKSPLADNARSTLLHETSHAQTIVGTDFYSQYALMYLRDGPSGPGDLLSRAVIEVMEAVPSAINRFGGEPHTEGTGTAASKSAARMVELVVRAAKDYYLFAVGIGMSAMQNRMAREHGVDLATLTKRSIVTGVVRAVLNCITYSFRTAPGQILAPETLIEKFTEKFSKYEEPDIFPRPTESIYQHIDRMMWPYDYPKKSLLVTEQLREPLMADRTWLLSNVQLLPALLRMEFMVYDDSVLRYTNFFNSAYPDASQMRQAVSKWLEGNALPFHWGRALRSLNPSLRCFSPLQLDGKLVRYHISEDPEYTSKLTKLVLFLQIREFYRQLPALLTAIHADPHPLFEQLAAEADIHSLAYLTRIEKEAAEFHGSKPASAYWSPDSYCVVSHVDPTYGEYFELELR